MGDDSKTTAGDDEVDSLIQAQDALLAERLVLNAEIERLRDEVASLKRAFLTGKRPV